MQELKSVCQQFLKSVYVVLVGEGGGLDSDLFKRESWTPSN